VEQFFFLIPIGLSVGILGSIVGAGGGFLLVPVLLLLYPNLTTGAITGVSLAVVFFNALSGSFAYGRMRRIDYKSGLLFAAATVPGSIAGSILAPSIPRGIFDVLVGIFLVFAAGYLGLKTFRDKEKPEKTANGLLFTRSLVDWKNVKYAFAYNPFAGFGLSLVVGFVSSLIGIGGGIIHVPILALALNFPVHIATATSHFILSIMALAGLSVHAASGSINNELPVIAALSIGVVIGAQIGARLSILLKGKWIIGGLAACLAVVGIRLIV